MYFHWKIPCSNTNVFQWIWVPCIGNLHLRFICSICMFTVSRSTCFLLKPFASRLNHTQQKGQKAPDEMAKTRSCSRSNSYSNASSNSNNKNNKHHHYHDQSLAVHKNIICQYLLSFVVYRMVPPSYKWVYKPHEYYSYICHKP